MDERGILEFMLASLHCPDPISTMSLRGQGLSIYKPGRRPSLRMVGWMDGWHGMGYQKCPSIFFILCTYESRQDFSTGIGGSVGTFLRYPKWYLKLSSFFTMEYTTKKVLQI